MTEDAYDKVTAAVARVTGWRPPNDKAAWRCPAHEDNSPSLSVNRGDKGVVIKCQAGCDTKDVLDRLGLTMNDLFDHDEPAGAPTGAARSSRTTMSTLAAACSTKSSASSPRRSDSAGPLLAAGGTGA